MQSNQQNKQRVMCKAGCGFYGSVANDSMCSKCFNETKNQNQVEPESESKPVSYTVDYSKQTIQEPESQKPTINEEVKKEESQGQEVDPKVQRNTNLCWFCPKKVGLVQTACKCGYIFCSKHKHSETHNCTYDYFSEQKERLMEQNSGVKHENFQRL